MQQALKLVPVVKLVIDDYLKTTNSRIYSAGDVTLGPQFVYVAAYEGGLAARNAIGGLNQKVNLEVVPGVTFTSPSIATVGLTEQQAKEKGYEVKHRYCRWMLFQERSLIGKQQVFSN